jgi:outer membrane biosynthesis protein TonB
VSRRERGRLRHAFLVSVVIHAAVVAFFWTASSRAESLPQLRVFAVDIVSPPPREAGEWSPEQPPAQETPAPEPEVEPAAEPEPEPAPPQPQPQRPAQPTPAPTPPRTEPSPAQRPTSTPEQPRPTPPAQERQTPPAERQAPAAARQAPPSTGQRPDPTSTGGEDLNVRIEGARFVDPEYLANIQRAINRYFRRPAGAQADVAEVQFYINRDGSVSEIELVRHTGSFAFRSAAMEAVEQAGLNRAFGPLPRAYPADRLLVSFYFRPAR